MPDTMFTHKEIPVGDYTLHAVEAGEAHPNCVVFLHGWPEDWTEWRRVMDIACQTHHVIAFDLPAVGKSKGLPPSGEKTAIADIIHKAVQSLGLTAYTLVGHDGGAMVAYAYLRNFSSELTAAVLISSVIPGIEPWSKVIQNPHLWHFAFHTIPNLPELLVMGKQREYFDYFFDLLTKNRETLDDDLRNHYATAYATKDALQSGFDLYRAFEKDATFNGEQRNPLNTPLLYLRGDTEYGDINEYIDGFKKAGLQSVTAATIPESGHFTPQENPAAVWLAITSFLEKQ